MEENEHQPVRADRWTGKPFLIFRLSHLESGQFWAKAIDGFQWIYTVIGVEQ